MGIIAYDDSQSVTSANTVRVDSFWFDEDNQSQMHGLSANDLMQLDGQKKQRELASYRMEKFSETLSYEEMQSELRSYKEEESKWNKASIAWQREKSNFEASNIEINLSLQQEKEKCKQAKAELSEITLNAKQIII